jgi:acetylornithine deacetylase/succinyl-diaminopimelate desuccinylase-like protein
VGRRQLIERVVRELASRVRPSASDGERRAAEWLAGELREAGCRSVRVEEERAHGGYWWPLGLLNAGALLASLRGRIPAALTGGLAAAAVYDDVSGGRLWFRRRALPHRPTWNVVAEAGDPGAERTVVFVSHHDAAHSGLVFHPALPRVAMRLLPRLHERADQSLPVIYGVFLGPLLLALWGLTGRAPLRGVGAFFAAGAVAAMADIGARAVVPGANDNLSAVAVIVALAHALREGPPAGVRVILLSTGSEESFMEGMQAFGRRHFPELPRATTEFVCIECVGSPQLCLVEGEGMLHMRYYDERSREALAAAGAAAGVELRRGLRTVAATDGLISLRAGYRTCTLGGIDESKFPANYHWPSDTPDNLSWESVEAALRVCEAYLRLTGSPRPRTPADAWPPQRE